jgi:hypothetical protein
MSPVDGAAASGAVDTLEVTCLLEKARLKFFLGATAMLA